MNSVIVFEVSQEEDGGFVAECLTEDIFTQGDSWEELRVNVNEAVKGYYFDQPSCPKVKLHLLKEEMLVIQ
jgi:predicted RNase H-like HicB family nuclease